MKSSVIVLFAGAMLAGCATQADIHGRAPERAETLAGAFGDVASCALTDLSAQHRELVLVRTGGGRSVRIDARVHGGVYDALVPDNYEWEAEFAPAPGDGTLVKVRARKGPFGDSMVPPDFWTIVMGCKERR